MKRLKMLRQIMKNTGADKIWMGFVGFFLLSVTLIWIFEPEMPRWRDAFWYCYAVVTTIGFGDVVAQSFVSRSLSVILSIYAVIVIAIVTGVVVNYYTQLAKLRQRDELIELTEKLEHLPELSKEELEAISRDIREWRARLGK